MTLLEQAAQARTIIFEGRVREADQGEALDVLTLGDTNLPEAFADALGERRRQVSVRYWISPEPLTEDQRTDAEVRIAAGDGYAEFISRYSDATGYLWTDVELTVGGHDLDAEIRRHLGAWCRLELVMHGDAKP